MTTESTPRLLVLPRHDFRRQLINDMPRIKRRFWWRLLRAYYQRNGPRRIDAENEPTIIVVAGAEADQRLLAHEYGHHLGLDHPPWLSWAMWFDVCGLGLRWTDKNNLLGKSAAWRREVIKRHRSLA